tara:strand:+ start:734 stop:2224 length:1491 start_codon:yes stop_codon:yes gene_type:complete
LKTDYINIGKLKSTGTNFMSSKDKYVFDRSLKQIKKLSDDTLDNKTISSFEAETILDEYWELVNGSLDIFQDSYASKRKRKKLLIVFNILYNGKRISTDTSLVKLINLFRDDTSEVNLNRWVSVLISSWENLINSRENFKLITKFIRSKFKESPLNLTRTLLLSKNKKLFLEAQGALNFAKEIIEKKTTHSELCEEVGIRFDSSSFHSIVVERLFEFYLKTKKYAECMVIIESIVDEPSKFSVRSRKKIVSQFIVDVDKHGLVQYIELAKATGFNSAIIGDPEKLMNWTVWEGGNTIDKAHMQKARLILNKWVLTAFVDVFFNVLINDPKRRAYWLGKVKDIQTVKVYGSYMAKRKLASREEIRPYIIDENGRSTNRFKLINSSKSNAGIVMDIGEHQIVEFSDSGALYCYLKGKGRIPKDVSSISELKIPSMELAASPQSSYAHKSVWDKGKLIYLNTEGRIIHQSQNGILRNGKIIKKDSWMDRMDLWIKHIAL